jgi:hypothetical protein
MKELVKEWLDQKLPMAALAAWGVRFADGSVASECSSNSLTPRQVEQAVNHLAPTGASLKLHGIEPVRLSWTFERIRIFLMTRDDGTCLAFFAENRPELSVSALEAALDEFSRLSF